MKANLTEISGHNECVFLFGGVIIVTIMSSIT